MSLDSWKRVRAFAYQRDALAVERSLQPFLGERWSLVSLDYTWWGWGDTFARFAVVVRLRDGTPWWDAPVYRIEVEESARGVRVCVTCDTPPFVVAHAIGQSLVKRLSNWARALRVEHQTEAGGMTGAGQCAETPIHASGSQHESGSQQDAPSESPTGDSDGAQTAPTPQDGSGEPTCANSVAQDRVFPHDNPAPSVSSANGGAWNPRAECPDGRTADTGNADTDATPSMSEATDGVETMNPEGVLGESPREPSTVPTVGVATEDAAVRQARRNILRAFKRAEPSRAARRATSAAFSTIRNAVPDRALVQRLRTAMARLAGGETEPAARWCATRTATKTAGYLRPWTTHDRRHESGRPAILVLPDVSGSMSQFADEVTALGSAVARLGVPNADVIVVVHVNGFPIEEQINQRPVRELPPCRTEDDAYRYYHALIRRYDVRAVFVAADWDGAWLYHWLAAQPSIERVYWMDVYCSTYGDPRPRPLPVTDDEHDYWQPVVHKILYADRCSDAADFVDAIEQMLGG